MYTQLQSYDDNHEGVVDKLRHAVLDKPWHPYPHLVLYFITVVKKIVDPLPSWGYDVIYGLPLTISSLE